MDGFEFTAAIVGSVLSFPVVVGVLVVLYRRRVGVILDRMATARNIRTPIVTAEDMEQVSRAVSDSAETVVATPAAYPVAVTSPSERPGVIAERRRRADIERLIGDSAAWGWLQSRSRPDAPCYCGQSSRGTAINRVLLSRQPNLESLCGR